MQLRIIGLGRRRRWRPGKRTRVASSLGGGPIWELRLDAHAAHQERCALLDSYLAYCLRLPERAPSGPALQSLAAAAAAVLSDPAQMQAAARFGWFVCDALVKWMMLAAHREGALGRDADRRKRFAPELYA